MQTKHLSIKRKTSLRSCQQGDSCKHPKVKVVQQWAHTRSLKGWDLEETLHYFQQVQMQWFGRLDHFQSPRQVRSCSKGENKPEKGRRR